MKNFKRRISITISVVAVLAIVWYLLGAMNYLTRWWSLPLTAAITGILAIIIPYGGRKVSTLYSINATGIVLLLLTFVEHSLPNQSNTFIVWAIIFLIGIVTETILNRSNIHLGTILLDLAISIVSTFVIAKFSSQFVTVGSLLITYLLIILIDFDFTFSIKGKKYQTYIEEDFNDVN